LPVTASEIKNAVGWLHPDPSDEGLAVGTQPILCLVGSHVLSFPNRPSGAGPQIVARLQGVVAGLPQGTAVSPDAAATNRRRRRFPRLRLAWQHSAITLSNTKINTGKEQRDGLPHRFSNHTILPDSDRPSYDYHSRSRDASRKDRSGNFP